MRLILFVILFFSFFIWLFLILLWKRKVNCSLLLPNTVGKSPGPFYTFTIKLVRVQYYTTGQEQDFPFTVWSPLALQRAWPHYCWAVVNNLTVHFLLEDFFFCHPERKEGTTANAGEIPRSPCNPLILGVKVLAPLLHFMTLSLQSISPPHHCIERVKIQDLDSVPACVVSDKACGLFCFVLFSVALDKSRATIVQSVLYFPIPLSRESQRLLLLFAHAHWLFWVVRCSNYKS